MHIHSKEPHHINIRVNNLFIVRGLKHYPQQPTRTALEGLLIDCFRQSIFYQHEANRLVFNVSEIGNSIKSLLLILIAIHTSGLIAYISSVLY